MADGASVNVLDFRPASSIQPVTIPGDEISSLTTRDSARNDLTIVSNSLHIFHLFPKLPLELQCRVWELVDITTQIHTIIQKKCSKKTRKRVTDEMSATSSPDWSRLPLGFHRLVDFIEKTFLKKEPDNFRWYEKEYRPLILRSTEPINPILQVCHNSRQVTLRRFNFIFAFGAYVNLDLDLICFDFGYIESASLLREIIPQIRQTCPEFRGIAVRNQYLCHWDRPLYRACEDLDDYILIHDTCSLKDSSEEQIVFVDYSQFWGMVPRQGIGKVRRHVVAVSSNLLDDLPDHKQSKLLVRDLRKRWGRRALNIDGATR